MLYKIEEPLFNNSNVLILIYYNKYGIELFYNSFDLQQKIKKSLIKRRIKVLFWYFRIQIW